MGQLHLHTFSNISIILGPSLVLFLASITLSSILVGVFLGWLIGARELSCRLPSFFFRIILYTIGLLILNTYAASVIFPPFESRYSSTAALAVSGFIFLNIL